MAKFQLTELQEKWLQELESGKYKQTDGRLHYEPGDESSSAYCCLGVAARFVLNLPGTYCEEFDAYAYGDSPEILVDYAKLGLRSSNADLLDDLYVAFYEALKAEGYGKDMEAALVDYNDAGATFEQIAAAIRAVPQAVFVAPWETDPKA